MNVVDPTEIIIAVNNVLPTFYRNLSLRLHLKSGSKLTETCLKTCNAEMQDECNILSTLNLEQWHEGFCLALQEVTLEKYPHFLVIQKILHYILNVHECNCLSICIDVINKLIALHPPSRKDMHSYYKNILLDRKFIQLTKTGCEQLGLFWCLVENLKTICLNIDSDVVENVEDTWQSKPDLHESIDEQVKELAEWLSTSNTKPGKGSGSFLRKKITSVKNEFFESLSWSKKLERCCLCLELAINILEYDFYFWYDKHSKWNKQLLCEDDCPLLVKILWTDNCEIGTLNHKVRQLIALRCSLLDAQHSVLIDRLIALTAEIIIISDSVNGENYADFKQNCMDFGREYAVAYLRVINENPTKIKDLSQIRPVWFRLLVCSTVLGNVIGKPCAPELSIICDVLENVLFRHKNVNTSSEKEERNLCANVDEKIIEKLKKLKSVNTKLKSGYGDTRLHVACRSGKVADVMALLTFPELDVNLTNNSGRTPLHEAADHGQLECVKLLLHLKPLRNDLGRCADTRLRDEDNNTPLLCAVLQNHVDVCQLLLRHTGSVLLEDLTENNETALEISKSEEMYKVLYHYKKNNITTVNSVREMYFDKDKTNLVINLCTVMTQSYLATHRTWDVYHFIKERINNKTKDSKDENLKKINTIKYQYTRYHKDFKTYLPKLRNILSKFSSFKLLKQELQPLICLLSLNKK